MSVSEEPIRSSSGIDYRLHGMTVPARPYAKRGLQTHGIMLLHCMRDDENGKYRFQLRDVEPVEIAIPDAPRETQCNCGGNTQNHACKHIFWLINKAMSAALLRGPRPTHPVVLENQGAKVDDIPTFELIRNVGLPELERVCTTGLNTDVERRAAVIVEMLSVFEPSGALPDEFRRHQPGMEDRRSIPYQELLNIVTPLLLTNEPAFLRLQEVLTPEFCAIVLFEKVDSRANVAFRDLDRYRKSGSVDTGPAVDNGRVADVVSCANELDRLVDVIDTNIVTRIQQVPNPSKAAGNMAASALVSILRGVAARTGNLYEDSQWRARNPQEPEENRNLVLRLIVNRDIRRGLFVLDALRKLSVHSLRIHRTELDEIRGLLERESRVSAQYHEALRTLSSV